MKKQKRIMSFGFLILLLGLLLTLTAAAINSPWIPLEPNTTTVVTEKPITTTETPTEKTNEATGSPTGEPEEVTDPSTQETIELVAELPTGEVSREEPKTEPVTPAGTVDARESEPSGSSAEKEGCGSSLSGIVVFLPLSFAAALIGRKRSE